jgi:hypothetical protein
MEENEELKRIIKLVQTSLHDQVNALKNDVNRALGDSETALEISATLEKSLESFKSGEIQLKELVETNSKVIQLLQSEIQDSYLDIKKIRMITGIDNFCFSLSSEAFIYITVSST